MSEIELIQGLKVKVERVISLYEVERSRNEDLTNLVEQYRSKIEDKNTKINELNNKIEQLERKLDNKKLVDAMMYSAKDKEAAKRMVSSLIREIDNCIALLNH